MVVGDSGEVCLRVDIGESPGFAAIVGEGEVRAVVARMFVVTSGDDAVLRVAEGDGEDSSRVGAVEDRSVDDLPGLSAVGRVKHAGDFAAGGEPDVGVGG